MQFRKIASLGILMCLWASWSFLGAQSRSFTDMAGRTVMVPAKVDRVVVIKGACMVPGILSALGQGEKLVSGLCFKRGADDLQLKVEPAYAKIDVISPNEAGVNLEELMALKPDLVFVWNNVKNVDQLEKAGIPVIVCDISTWDHVRSMFLLIGEIMGAQKKAGEMLAFMDKTAAEVKKKTDVLKPSERKRVLFVSKTTPLSLMGNTSHNSFMIEMAGGISAADQLAGHFVDVSMEQMYAVDPDVLFVSAASPQALKEILENPQWQALKAVKTRQVYLCPSGVFFWDKPSAEIPLFLLWQAHILYPELISGKELYKACSDYYQTFFSYKLSNKELNNLLGAY